LDGSAPIGGTVVPASDIADPQALTVVTKVNGEVVNEMPLSRTVRGVAELISTISYIMTLQPGDVIAVAFPGSRAPVNKGDKVTSEIAGVVSLNNLLGQ
jgi:5-oxopent-3-ene-1,2,5-tricarboxylate decarboxylase/2-hydroxyhepta-2,4-diene-1,7-dioate isomerase